MLDRQECPRWSHARTTICSLPGKLPISWDGETPARHGSSTSKGRSRHRRTSLGVNDCGGVPTLSPGQQLTPADRTVDNGPAL